MDADKLAKMAEQVRTGGKGSARRKRKVVHKTNTTDDKKLQTSLKKLAVNSIPGIEEVNLIKDDGSVVHFNNPKVQASLQSNIFSINGTAETKKLQDLLPNILNQLGAENLKKLVEGGGGGMFGGGMDKPPVMVSGADDDEEEIPELVGDNFEETANQDD